MAVLGRLPLAPTMTTRGLVNSYPAVGKDNRLIRCIPVEDGNSVLRQTELYVEKIPGFFVSASLGGSNVGTLVFHTLTVGALGTIVAYGATNSTLYTLGSNLGTITGKAYFITDAIVSGVGYALITSSDGTGWYFANDAASQTAYTADGNNSTTITDIKVSGVPSVAGLYVGQKLTASSNIVAGSRIVSINASAFSAVLDTATNGGAFNDLAITKEPIAKIISANFPSIVGPMVAMDGYIFALTEITKRIYQSALNSVTTWDGFYITGQNFYGSRAVAIHRVGNRLVMMTNGGLLFFYNAGNASGSVLSEDKGASVAASVMPYGASPTPFVKPFSRFGNKLIWLSTEVGIGRQLYVMEGREIRTVKSQMLSSALKEITTTACVYGINLAGDDYAYIWGTGADTSTFQILVNLRNGYVSEPGFGHLFAFSESQYTPVMTAVSTNNTTGALYQMSANPIFQDDGVAYTATIQLSDNGFGTQNRKTGLSYRLVADKQASGFATLEYSDDDGVTFVAAPGVFDLTKKDMRITRCGSYTGHRLLRITHNSNTAFRARAIIVEGEMGVN